MGRRNPEWIGKTDDTPVPDRVRVRVFDRFKGRCHRCNRQIRPGDKWVLEHHKALINGGGNKEGNLCLTCSWCLPVKNAEDVAEKSDTYDIRRKHVLPHEPKRKWPSRPFKRQDSKCKDINRRLYRLHNSRYGLGGGS